MTNRVKIQELREKDEGKLLKDLYNFKKELLQMRTLQATGANAQKLVRIRSLRKSIARVLTIYNEKRYAASREKYENKKFIPKDLRKKSTRAWRRRLTPQQANKKSVKAQKKASNLPIRRYLIIQN